jgi:hypothetical protein
MEITLGEVSEFTPETVEEILKRTRAKTVAEEKERIKNLESELAKTKGEKINFQARIELLSQKCANVIIKGINLVIFLGLSLELWKLKVQNIPQFRRLEDGESREVQV